jgi:hypothetical protein
MGARILAAARGAQAVGGVVRGVAEVFTPNATRRMELGHEAFRIAHETHGAEFQHRREGWFDRCVNGLNRLPRPILALGTLGLFVFAMADPAAFTVRMRGLAEVPEPLWWLLGAVVSFYFGAREAHYLRQGAPARAPRPTTAAAQGAAADSGADAAPKAPPDGRVPGLLAEAPNPALDAWRDAAARGAEADS